MFGVNSASVHLLTLPRRCIKQTDATNGMLIHLPPPSLSGWSLLSHGGILPIRGIKSQKQHILVQWQPIHDVYTIAIISKKTPPPNANESGLPYLGIFTKGDNELEDLGWLTNLSSSFRVQWTSAHSQRSTSHKKWSSRARTTSSSPMLWSGSAPMWDGPHDGTSTCRWRTCKSTGSPLSTLWW